MTKTQTAASFLAATIAPIGSLARLEQAAEWIYGAMYDVNDSAVEFALSQLQGWQTFPTYSDESRHTLATLITECEDYMADVLESV